jgi:aspartate/methionine/tyrosine aminotransferase
VTAFEDFVALQTRVPDGTLSLGETRIARALASLRPAVEPPASFSTIHRCDLARAWCASRGMPEAWSGRALVCEGVRHALALIFGELARRGEPVALPRDVYPVYWRIAADAGTAAIGFDTFPELAHAFATPARHVVLPCPLKLHGRAWTDGEFAAASRWLAADRTRRLILDGVYSFGERTSDGVLELCATDQVIYLDSLSKGWLHERVFGTAIVPARDAARFAPIFRAAAPPQRSLYRARALLEAPRPPVEAALVSLRARTIELLASRGIESREPRRGYLVPIRIAADVALAEHRTLLVPFAVFGGHGPWSFASALGAAGTT